MKERIKNFVSNAAIKEKLLLAKNDTIYKLEKGDEINIYVSYKTNDMDDFCFTLGLNYIDITMKTVVETVYAFIKA